MNLYNGKTYKNINYFNYFTNIYTTKAGTVYYFVYDQGYLPIDGGDYYALVKRKTER